MDPMHKESPQGGFFTRNVTSDPRYPDGYYESMGWKGYGHNTNVFGPDGSLLHQTNPSGVLEAARNQVLDAWQNR